MGKRRTREEKIRAKARLANKPIIVVKEQIEESKETKVVIGDLVRTSLITLGLLAILLVLYWRLR